jgi:hydroxymethylglutaryl-CoA reductase
MKHSLISGFSKLSKEQQIAKIATYLEKDENQLLGELKQYWHIDHDEQRKFDEFAENTISNYYLPFNIAPNFIINDNYHFVPMVIEESSVVAAAAHAGRFWAKHGGFRCHIPGITKLGHIHFFFYGNSSEIEKQWPLIKNELLKTVEPVEANMKKRGGGITSVALKNLHSKLENFYQIEVAFDTKDSMGANFINSCLETMAETLIKTAASRLSSGEVEVLMSILSNYTPECLVECSVETHINAFDELKTGFSALNFARRFEKAVQVATIDPYRAATHNKGIYNGVDAVVLATGNDFRAIEACGHTYAARNGAYTSLTSIEIKNDNLRYTLRIPMALGVVGGLTKLHPLAALSMEILGNPSAEYLMMVAAAAGLANNFSAVRSLVTHGIQKGHMKMHLNNIVSGISASEVEKQKILEYFADKTVSFHSVELYLNNLRSKA